MMSKSVSRQKVHHEIKKFIMTSKTRHEVKKFVMM